MSRQAVKKSMKTKTTLYDVAEQLRTPGKLVAYLDAWLEDAPDDPTGIARALSVTRKLQILLGDVVSRPADLHLRAVRLVNPRQRIVMVTATAAAAATVVALVIPVTSPHALVLSVSHGSPVADSCLQRLLPRRFVHPTSSRTFQKIAHAGLDDPAGARRFVIGTLMFVRWPLWLR